MGVSIWADDTRDYVRDYVREERAAKLKRLRRAMEGYAGERDR